MKNKSPHPLCAFSARKRFLLAMAAFLVVAAGARAQFVTTLISSNLSAPNGVTVDVSSNAYITDTDNNRIIKYNPASQTFVTFAGLPGNAGANNGVGEEARFSQPLGIVFDAGRGGLVVVDQGNQMIRLVSIPNAAVSTLAGTVGVQGTNDGAGSSALFRYPSGVAIDAAGNLYVTDQGNNLIRKIDVNGNVTTVNTTDYSFHQPTGIAVDNNSNLWVADTGNQVICLISNQAVYPIAGVRGDSGYADFMPAAQCLFSVPTGLLWDTNDNSLLIADSGNDVIRKLAQTDLFGPSGYIVQTVAGIPDDPGRVDGTPLSATFDKPMGLSVDPYDTGFYVVDLDGSLREFQPAAVVPPPPPPPAPSFGYVTYDTSTTPPTPVFNAVTNATFNNLITMAIESPDGTPTFYSYGPTGGASVGTNLTASLFPEFLPNYASPSATFYAYSQNAGGPQSATATAQIQFVTANPIIVGTNANNITLSNITTGAAMYYTLNGTAPTNGVSTNNFGPVYNGQNLPPLNISSNTTLSVIAFAPSFTPSGVATEVLALSNVVVNAVGFMQKTNYVTSGGDNAYVPISVSMADGLAQLESIQFAVQVEPAAGSPPAILESLDFETNQLYSFDQETNANLDTEDPSIFTYSVGSGQGLALVLTNFTLDGSGRLGFLRVPIPATAVNGQTYSVTFLNASGTTDGHEAGIVLGNTTNWLTIGYAPFLLGDTSPSSGLDGGDFGDGLLENNDVVNAMYASMGVYIPPPDSDAWKAMKVTEVNPTTIGIQDWETILLRSLGVTNDAVGGLTPSGFSYDPTNYIGFYTNGNYTTAPIGFVTNGAPVTLSASHIKKSSASSTPPGLVWLRQSALRAGTQENVAPGATCSIPVYLLVSPGYSVSALQFRAVLSSAAGTPSPAAITFAAAAGIPNPIHLPGTSANDILCAWPLGTYSAPLTGSNYVGTIIFKVPATAEPGQSYTVHFIGTDGIAGAPTPLAFGVESFPASVWINSAAKTAPSITSDEWKLAFFGSVSNPLAADNVDADGDGMANWQEYLAGTNPTNALSKLQFGTTSLNADGVEGASFNWLTAPSKTYTLQSSPTLNGPVWTSVKTIVGDGNNYEFLQPDHSGNAQFYQLRVSQ